jgi:hypothetical protein
VQGLKIWIQVLIFNIVQNQIYDGCYNFNTNSLNLIKYLENSLISLANRELFSKKLLAANTNSFICNNNQQKNLIHNYNSIHQIPIVYGVEEKREMVMEIKSAKEKFYALKAKKNKRHFQVIYMFKNK